MKNPTGFKMSSVAPAGAALIALLAAPAQAVTYTVVAEAVNVAMPDGVSVVPMWGYRVSAPGGDLASALAAPITSPGAALVVPPLDATLGVTLHNRLPRGAPTSLVVHGLNTAMLPVFADAKGGACTPGAAAAAGLSADEIRYGCRVRSFTAEAVANGAAVTYTYNNVRPGTYLYQSGTQPQIQVQMGLYGMLSKDAAAGVVYPGVAYANQSRVIFSEVDAAMHAAVAAGTFTGSTLDYDARHFRAHVYGADNLPVQANAGGVAHFIGSTVPQLVRLANAGLQTRVPTLSDGTWALLGEDAQPYPFAREQYTAFLPAAKTTEAWIGASRSFSVFDRRMAFGDSPGGVAGQFLQFSTTPVATALTANCPSVGTQGAAWTCTVSSPTPGATLALVSGPLGMTALAGVGALTLNWTPANAQAQRPAAAAITNPVVVAATAPSGTTTHTFSVAVANLNDAPTAMANSYAAGVGVRSLNIPVATGVLANDGDIDGDALSVSLVTPPVDGTLVLNPDGSFSYSLAAATLVPAGGLTRSFTYRATDTPSLLTPAPALSADATVTLTFALPATGLLANPDGPFTFANTTARPAQTYTVLANDTSDTTPAFQLDSIQVSRTGTQAANVLAPDAFGASATRGAIQTPDGGTIVYQAPNSVSATVPFTGNDFFFYRVRNNNGVLSNWTRVDVTMPPPAPFATAADALTYTGSLTRTAQTINVLANDVPGIAPFNLTNIQVARDENGLNATVGQLEANNTRGTVQTPNSGMLLYSAPLNTNNNTTRFTGSDFFYYRVRDASGTFSLWTRVDVRVN